MIELSTIYDGLDKIFITECGKLISYRGKQPIIMKTYFDKKGYEYCKIWNGQKYIHISIHIAVAKAFIPNPDNKETVNHKDRVKSHNYSSNLEWMTLKENVEHAQNGLRNNKECSVIKDGIEYRFPSKSQACRYASENFGASKSALQKYGKSNGCVIIESVTTSG